MFELKRSMYTETSHRLAHHKGLCANIHGHSYKWTVTIGGRHLNSDGMLMDFGDLKEAMNSVIEKYDHAVILQDGVDDEVLAFIAPTGGRVVILKSPPTAEVMAKTVALNLRSALPARVLSLKVTCRETENNEASYEIA